MPDENGETRRERNERFEQDSPELEIPISGEYLWDWYFDLARGVDRINDGYYAAIPWSEYHFWAKVRSFIVQPWEIDILAAMDEAYRAELNKEVSAFHERQKDAQSRARK